MHCDEAVQYGIQVIRRFTGGGTVVVDHDTVFSSLIMQAGAITSLDCWRVVWLRIEGRAVGTDVRGPGPG